MKLEKTVTQNQIFTDEIEKKPTQSTINRQFRSGGQFKNETSALTVVKATR
ncbi:hypothetical protein LOAG_12976 [Loa loa]|nr:hypothetical protein LOAG_12976 [Loa loa]EFO15533.1 hypothetical protein LOAG_12976 [Loa loa]